MNNAPKRIVMYATSTCGDCIRSRNYLDDNHIAYEYINIEEDDEAAKIVGDINNGMLSVPTIIFPNGKILVEPSNKELGEALLVENGNKTNVT